MSGLGAVHIVISVLKGVLEVVTLFESKIPEPARGIVDSVVQAIQAALESLDEHAPKA